MQGPGLETLTSTYHVLADSVITGSIGLTVLVVSQVRNLDHTVELEHPVGNSLHELSHERIEAD
jgi:hypothetical protein